MSRLRFPNPLAAAALKSLAFLGYVSCFYLFGHDGRALLWISLAALLVAVGLWHERRELIRLVVTAVVMTATEILLTSDGIYTYRARDLVSVPYWLPVGWAFFSLIIFRIVRDLSSHWRSETQQRSAGAGKRLFEILSIPLLAISCHLFWTNTLACALGSVAFLLVAVRLYPGAMGTLIAVCVPAAAVLELAAIAGGAWRWHEPDILGLPLWVPMIYPFLIFANHRLAVAWGR